MRNDIKIREEKLKHLLNIGYTADIEKGIVYNSKGIECKSIDDNGYIRVSTTYKGKNTGIRIHTLIYYIYTNEVPLCIDHKDGDKLNNRISNLRAVTSQGNSWNRHKDKGYTWSKRDNKWMPQLTVNGKSLYLGLFDNEEDAREAYLKAKLKYFKIESV